MLSGSINTLRDLFFCRPSSFLFVRSFTRSKKTLVLNSELSLSLSNFFVYFTYFNLIHLFNHSLLFFVCFVSFRFNLSFFIFNCVYKEGESASPMRAEQNDFGIRFGMFPCMFVGVCIKKNRKNKTKQKSCWST